MALSTAECVQLVHQSHSDLIQGSAYPDTAINRWQPAQFAEYRKYVNHRETDFFPQSVSHSILENIAFEAALTTRKAINPEYQNRLDPNEDVAKYRLEDTVVVIRVLFDADWGGDFALLNGVWAQAAFSSNGNIQLWTRRVSDLSSEMRVNLPEISELENLPFLQICEALLNDLADSFAPASYGLALQKLEAMEQAAALAEQVAGVT